MIAISLIFNSYNVTNKTCNAISNGLSINQLINVCNKFMPIFLLFLYLCVLTMKLSIIIPVFNEERTILSILEKLLTVQLNHQLEKELIIVNDCSTDQSDALILKFQEDHQELALKYFIHPFNQGKGAAIHTGIKESTGDYIIIQDADMEYNPDEFNLLLEPALLGFADVVYGSRFMGGNPHRILFFWHSIGNKFLTFLSNVFTNLNLTDMETCYKLFRADILKSIVLKEKRFGFEPEVTAKMSRYPNVRIYEVGISYFGRTYSEGKKINWKDGIRALYCILKYNVF